MNQGCAGRAGAKKPVNQLIPKILQKCVNEKCNITYYDINYDINPNIIILGEPLKQIFGKSWEFGRTGLTPPGPPSPNVGILSVNLSEIFGKKGSNMP